MFFVHCLSIILSIIAVELFYFDLLLLVCRLAICQRVRRHNTDFHATVEQVPVQDRTLLFTMVSKGYGHSSAITFMF